MSWESSALYYRMLNEHVRDRLGGSHSARCLLWSFDFADIAAMQHRNDWDAAAAALVDAAGRLHRAGADFLVLCTNTMHRLAPALEAVPLPLLHIADPTAERVRAAGLRRVGLLGTAFTMEAAFLRDRLRNPHGLDVVVPDAEDRALVHRVIYEELVQGRILPESRDAYRGVIARLAERGAEAVILGCTEITLLVGPADSPVPLFDTTSIHAEAAADLALE